MLSVISLVIPMIELLSGGDGAVVHLKRVTYPGLPDFPVSSVLVSSSYQLTLSEGQLTRCQCIANEDLVRDDVGWDKLGGGEFLEQLGPRGRGDRLG